MQYINTCMLSYLIVSGIALGMHTPNRTHQRKAPNPRRSLPNYLRQSIDSGSTPKRARTSQEEPCFDPRNYHAAINRHSIPGDTNIHTSLQAMACGSKQIYLGHADDIQDLTTEEKEQIRSLGISKLLFHTGEAPDQIIHNLILYTKQAHKHARLMQEMITADDRAIQLLDLMECSDSEQLQRKLQQLRQTFPLGNAYLTGKLLGYPEDDIVYFYERNDQLSLLAGDLQKAEEFLVTRNLTL